MNVGLEGEDGEEGGGGGGGAEEESDKDDKVVRSICSQIERLIWTAGVSQGFPRRKTRFRVQLQKKTKVPSPIYEENFRFSTLLADGLENEIFSSSS